MSVKTLLVTPMSHRSRQDGQISHQEKDPIWVEEEGQQEGVISIANAMTSVYAPVNAMTCIGSHFIPKLVGVDTDTQ